MNKPRDVDAFQSLYDAIPDVFGEYDADAHLAKLVKEEIPVSTDEAAPDSTSGLSRLMSRFKASLR